MYSYSQWRQTAINLFDLDSYSSYSTSQMGLFYRVNMWLEGDSLIAPIQTVGGCLVHDFFLIGTCPPDTGNIIPLGIYLLQDNHGDTCEAIISRTLKIDLAPLRSCGLAADSVALHYINDTTTVMFDL